MHLKRLVGRRIRLRSMPGDPAPLPVGSTGTVTFVHHVEPGLWQVGVWWDCQRTLMLSVPPDTYEVIE
jgi:hypothetical protein